LIGDEDYYSSFCTGEEPYCTLYFLGVFNRARASVRSFYGVFFGEFALVNGILSRFSNFEAYSMVCLAILTDFLLILGLKEHYSSSC
jgi:hypothetical protein